MKKMLFSTGTARGGTNLGMKSLSVSPEAHFACDPFLALFKHFRSSSINPGTSYRVGPEEPLSDYYYFEDNIQLLAATQDAQLETHFPDYWRDGLKKSLKSRMQLTSPLLVECLDMLKGSNYRELFLQSMEMVAAAYSASTADWLGYNENWGIEVFAALARSFPEAHFLIIVRDPRAAICSSLNQKDETKMVQVLPFIRGWRKNIALAYKFSADELFRDRLTIFRYEDFVSEPDKYLRMLCEILHIGFEEKMLDPQHYKDGAGRFWKGNSHIHGKRPPGIYSDSIDAWKTKLPWKICECIEFVAGKEMKINGYDLQFADERSFSSEAFGFFLDNDKSPSSWKSSTAPIDTQLGWEWGRHQMLDIDGELPEDLIKRYFLCKQAYQALKEQRLLPLLGYSPYRNS